MGRFRDEHDTVFTFKAANQLELLPEAALAREFRAELKANLYLWIEIIEEKECTDLYLAGYVSLYMLVYFIYYNAI